MKIFLQFLMIPRDVLNVFCLKYHKDDVCVDGSDYLVFDTKKVMVLSIMVKTLH